MRKYCDSRVVKKGRFEKGLIKNSFKEYYIFLVWDYDSDVFYFIIKLSWILKLGFVYDGGNIVIMIVSGYLWL